MYCSLPKSTTAHWLLLLEDGAHPPETYSSAAQYAAQVAAESHTFAASREIPLHRDGLYAVLMSIVLWLIVAVLKLWSQVYFSFLFLMQPPFEFLSAQTVRVQQSAQL
jgi:hypothetical protein